MIRSAIRENTVKLLSDLNMTLAALEVRDLKVKKWKLQFKLHDNEVYLRINNKSKLGILSLNFLLSQTENKSKKY